MFEIKDWNPHAREFFDIEKFKEEINKEIGEGKTKRSSADIYVYRLEQYNNTLKEFTSSEFSKATMNDSAGLNAIRKYEKLVLGAHHTLLTPTDYMESRRTSYMDLKGKQPEFKWRFTYERKIKAVKRDDIRLALRFQIRTGLRIGELANLKPEDVKVHDNGIIVVHVKKGKSGERYVHSIPDKKLAEDMKNFNGFPKRETIMNNAPFKTHDLRRIFARDVFWHYIKEGYSKSDSLTIVARELGDKERQNAIVYLGRDWHEYRQRKKEVLGEMNGRVLWY